MKRITLTSMILPAIMALAATGCSPAPDMRDERLAQFAEQSLARQAEQNEYIATQSEAIVEQTQEVVDASKELVATDAKTRQELLAAQDRLNSELNAQRAAIDQGRDELERERKQLAEHCHRDPIVAASIQTVGLLVAALLPLLVCAYVIRQMGRSEPDDAAVAELLVHELATDRPRLLPGPSFRPALEQHAESDPTDDTAADVQPDAADFPF